jgi:hypothetical protein
MAHRTHPDATDMAHRTHFDATSPVGTSGPRRGSSGDTPSCVSIGESRSAECKGKSLCGAQMKVALRSATESSSAERKESRSAERMGKSLSGAQGKSLCGAHGKAARRSATESRSAERKRKVARRSAKESRSREKYFFCFFKI